jgi:hypothetical protein
MSEKRSPTKVMEKTKPDKEHRFIKYAGKDPIEVGLNGTAESVDADLDKIQLVLDRHGRKPYADIHSHPYDPKEMEEFKGRKFLAGTGGAPLPSRGDLRSFLKNDLERTMYIQQRNIQTGDVEGYFVLRKKADGPRIGYSPHYTPDELKKIHFSNGLWEGIKSTARTVLYGLRINRTTRKYHTVLAISKAIDEPTYITKALERISERYGLQYKFVPAKDFELDKEGLRFRKKKGLEDHFLLGISFVTLVLSSVLGIQITGTVIAESRSFIRGGGTLLVVVIVILIIALLRTVRLKN